MRDITGDEIIRANQDLSILFNSCHSIINNNLDYIAQMSSHLGHNNLIKTAGNLLARIAKGHSFYDLNKRTAYFSTRYFLMKNGADFNGLDYKSAAHDVVRIASANNLESALALATNLCERDIVTKMPIIKTYDNFYRLVLKSIGVAQELSDM